MSQISLTRRWTKPSYKLKHNLTVRFTSGNANHALNRHECGPIHLSTD